MLMNKAVVTLLICSFMIGHAEIANYLHPLSYNIIAVTGDGYFERTEISFTDDEYRRVLQSLIRLKNSLIAQGRYTDGVDDVLCKMLSAKKRKLKIKYI